MVLEGQVPFASLPRYLAAADISVIPQQDNAITRAQVPAKLIDAMCMGLPVVATDVGEMKQLVGAFGRVVTPNDAEAFAGALHELLTDAKLRNRMGTAAREQAVREYSYSSNAARLHQHLEGALRQSVQRGNVLGRQG